jgi:putative hemolysin
VAPVIARLGHVARWIVTTLTASTNVVLRLFGQGRVHKSPFTSEDEVKYLVREGAAKGVFEKVEEELVHNAFEFADTTVREIMVPRVHIVGIDIETPADQILRRAAQAEHSRIPVYRDSIEHALGVVTLRDLFRVVAHGESIVLASLMRPPQFIPETARISAVLREFQRTRQYLAFVVDEYGGVVGLVTLEDVLEEIVGEIREPGECVPSFVVRRTDAAVVIHGVTPIRQIREQLNVPVPDSSDYTTAAGLVMHLLGSIPKAGAAVSYGGYRWTVLEMTGPQVMKLKIEPLRPDENSSDASRRS